MIAAAASTMTRNSGGVTPSLIRNLQTSFYKFQRHNVPFTITNTTTGTGTWDWKVLDLGDSIVSPSIYATSTLKNPEFTLPEGNYLVYLSSQGLNPDPVARVFWDKRITVLPVMFTEGEADRVLSLDDGNNIFDASSWGDGERIFLKKIDATVGRIRIDNYTSATKAHLLIDPASLMEVNAFSGSHGLYLVNCQNLLIDAVGSTDEHGLYLNGEGQNTSHGLNLNTISDIRCEFIEIYGVRINVTQSGASAVRVLGDESATYNRTLAPCDGLKFAHFYIDSAGHEALYPGFTNDTDTGDGGPRQFINLEAWDWEIVTCGRDAIQPCNQINARIHNFIIHECATLGEPSHNSYIVHNSGCQNVKIFNIIGRAGVHGISMQFGETGANPFLWNIVLEVETLASQSAWDFIQVGSAPDTDITMMNITIVALSGDEIVHRFDSDSGQGPQDITDFTLINSTTIKGTSGAFFQKDGTNSEAGWDRTSGNLTYTPATAATALLDAVTHLPSDILSPSITDGVAWTTRRTAAEMLSEYDALSFQFDIDGYIITDSEYPSGAGAGIELKLAAL